jgi:hypothetical protein
MDDPRGGMNGNGPLSPSNLEEGALVARERLEELGRSVLRFVRERPGMALALALGAGYVVGRVLRR